MPRRFVFDRNKRDAGTDLQGVSMTNHVGLGGRIDAVDAPVPWKREILSAWRDNEVHVALRLKGGNGNLGFNMISKGAGRRKRLGSVVVVRLMICCGSFKFLQYRAVRRT